MNIAGLWDGAYGLWSLSENTRESNLLQMSLERQHFLLSYLKTLSVGPAGVELTTSRMAARWWVAIGGWQVLSLLRQKCSSMKLVHVQNAHIKGGT